MKVFAFVFAGWIFSLCLHEFSHALTAYLGGDKSVKDKGYLTFNPLKYTHPVLSIVYPLIFLLLGGIGLPGGAVYVDHSRLRGRVWESAVSLAGPLSNTLLVLVMAVPFLAGLVDPATENWVWMAYAFLFQLQISAVLFNLIPIPPLDGFGVLAPWFPRKIRSRLRAVSEIGLWVIFALFWFVPEVRHHFWSVVGTIMENLGVSRDLAWDGYRAFRFW
jgi:Zn-dependent protease